MHRKRQIRKCNRVGYSNRDYSPKRGILCHSILCHFSLNFAVIVHKLFSSSSLESHSFHSSLASVFPSPKRNDKETHSSLPGNHLKLTFICWNGWTGQADAAETTHNASWESRDNRKGNRKQQEVHGLRESLHNHREQNNWNKENGKLHLKNNKVKQAG